MLSVEVSMRIIMIGLTILLLSARAFGQVTKQPDPEPDSTMQLSNPITVSQILSLPKRDAPPRINLKQALKIAENFIRKGKINISSCYLFEAKWISDQLGAEPSWHFWWVGVRGRASDDVRITVSMNGDAEVSSSP
jgi:hypothetical protein